MRYFLIAVTLVFLAACNSEDKKPAEAEKKTVSLHSAEFNKSFDAMMANYYDLTEAFVNWDSNAVNVKATALENSLKAIALDDLKKDTSEYTTARETLKNVTANAEEITKSPDIAAKRQNLHALTQNIYDLLRAVKYDEKKLYLQECPMAFNNETESGFWLTDKGTDSIRNPYFGLHHPKYGHAMINCGNNKSTIDFQK